MREHITPSIMSETISGHTTVVILVDYSFRNQRRLKEKYSQNLFDCTSMDHRSADHFAHLWPIFSWSLLSADLTELVQARERWWPYGQDLSTGLDLHPAQPLREPLRQLLLFPLQPSSPVSVGGPAESQWLTVTSCLLRELWKPSDLRCSIGQLSLQRCRETDAASDPCCIHLGKYDSEKKKSFTSLLNVGSSRWMASCEVLYWP